MKLEQAEQESKSWLEPGERVLVGDVAVPLVNATGLNAADVTRGIDGGPGKGLGLAIGGWIARRNDALIQRDAVTGEQGSIAQAVPREAKALGLVLTDRRLALCHHNVRSAFEDIAWEVPRERVVGVRKLARTTFMRRMRVRFDDGSSVDLSLFPGKTMGRMREELGSAEG